MNSVYMNGEMSVVPPPRVIPDWDTYFLNQCDLVATRSKDRSTQIGAIVVGPKLHEVRTQGYNGFPSKVNDRVEARYVRPLKYLFTEHAERNAIYLAARTGISLDGCTMYVPATPCADCARAIIQAGISKVVLREPFISKRWRESCRVSMEMFMEAEVCVKVVNNDYIYQNFDLEKFDKRWPANREE